MKFEPIFHFIEFAFKEHITQKLVKTKLPMSKNDFTKESLLEEFLLLQRCVKIKQVTK